MPADPGELRTTLVASAEREETIKVVGSGHSANGVALTTGTHVSMEMMDRLVKVDSGRRTATVEAGMRLADLNKALDEAGLAVASLGDIDRQTVAGAMATGTHGSSLRHGSLSSQTEAMTVMLADGSVVRCSREVEPDLFAAVRTGLGAIGIVLEVTLRCVPAFRLHQRMWSVTHDELDANLTAWLEEYPYFDLLYDPRNDAIVVRSRTQAEADQPSRSRRETFVDDWLAQLAYGAFCWLDRANPARFDRHIARLPASSRLDCVDRSDRLFVLPSLIKLVSSEWAVPLEDTVPLMRKIGAQSRARGINPGHPMHIRFTAGDDAFLSPAYERQTGWINLPTLSPFPWQEYLGAAGVVARDAGARPHWGKWHAATRASLEPLYPCWDDFRKVRAAVDPDARFANAYLDSALGPVEDRQPAIKEV